jgi:hypothetical protein
METSEQRLAELTQRDRVRAHTASGVNAQIDRVTAGAIAEAAGSGRDGLVRRAADLDHEWDVDRALMANFAVLAGLTYALSRQHPFWRWLFRAQLGFLLWHALVGWCPPVAAFRRLGFRTVREIEVERQEIARRLASSQASGAAARRGSHRPVAADAAEAATGGGAPRT